MEWNGVDIEDTALSRANNIYVNIFVQSVGSQPLSQRSFSASGILLQSTRKLSELRISSSTEEYGEKPSNCFNSMLLIVEHAANSKFKQK